MMWCGEGSHAGVVRHVSERLKHGRDTVELVVISFSDADRAVSP
jgi:hypothetical protein